MALMINAHAITYAIFGGLLPALLWLFFWQREDDKRPEPRGVLIRTFLFGGLSVALVIPLERFALLHLHAITPLTFLIWAILEEGFKFASAYFGGLNCIEDDEPIDPLIYMITAALGFVAVENALFIVNPLLASDVTLGVITGGLRFIGSSLLHTVSSSVIGLALSLTFYKGRLWQTPFILLSFIIAVMIHTVFNLFISAQGSLTTFYTFAIVWAGAALLLYSFEKVKTIAP